ncbi:MAG: peptidase, partial [Candidatus Nitrosomaritimum yanchengensis]
PLTSIPSWVKNVAGFWCQNHIDDASFVEGIQYLIDNGIIVVPAKSKVISDTQEVPQWVKNNACWWSEGSITDLDFASGIEYLVREGIIVV